MSLLERIKGRIETDLSDTELQLLIDEATSAIVRRFGGSVVDPSSVDPVEPVTVVVPGGTASLFLNPPIDIDADDLEVIETSGGVDTTLVAADVRAWHGGRRLERLATGTNPRARWGNLVTLTYTPVDDTDERNEVVIKLVMLSITYQGLIKGDRAGDTSSYGSLTADSYQKERELLLASLSPPLMA